MLKDSQLNPWIAWSFYSLSAVALLVLTKGGKIPRGDHAGDTKGDMPACVLFLVIDFFVGPMLSG